MTIAKLSGAAEDLLTTAYLTPEQQDETRVCVQHYTTPETWVEMPTYLLFRMGNIFKYFIYGSEWSLTSAMLKEHALEMARQKGLIPEGWKRWAQLVDLRSGIIEDARISACLSFNNGKVESTDDSRKIAESLDLKASMGELEKWIEKIKEKHRENQESKAEKAPG